jgi:hypothetical protein
MRGFGVVVCIYAAEPALKAVSDHILMRPDIYDEEPRARATRDLIKRPAV